MTDVTKALPEFATSMRGYDRVQVDEYVDRLHAVVADAEERARAAEAELEFSRHATIGPRVAQIFELAVKEAQELRERVQQDAERTTQTAERRAQEIVSTAQAEGNELRETAQRERESTLAEADGYREQTRVEVVQLHDRKARLLGDLKQLHGALADAAGMADDDAEPATTELRAAADDQQTAEREPVPARAGNGTGPDA
jgi:cell division septum initiation protein DivIVA